MKLYAAFSEYGDIWPTTIRRTQEEAYRALCAEPGIDPTEPLKGGVCIGAFGFGGEIICGGPLSGCLDKPFPPKIETVTWLHGWRAKK